MKPSLVCKHCYLIEVASDSFLLLGDLVQSVRYDNLLVHCRPENEVTEGQLVPLSLVVYPLILVVGTADSDRSIAFSHCITLLSLCDFERGLGVCPDQQAFGGLPNAMLAVSKRLFFIGYRHFSPLPIVSVRYRHTRSTLRDNRFHCNRWDNYPIWTAAAKTAHFVRDSNSAVTVKLPTRKPTDTPRR